LPYIDVAEAAGKKKMARGRWFSRRKALADTSAAFVILAGWAAAWLGLRWR
jgi:hypothetical protein